MNAAAQTFLEKTVAEVMSTDLITLKLNDTLRLADDMFNLAQVRHFPVLDGDMVAGIVNQDDLLHASMASLARHPNDSPREALGAVVVKDIMKTAITISPDLPIRAAAKTMIENGIEALLVVSGEKLLGLVTRTDLLRELAKA
jgi:CBS domain-containing membrane protein